MLIKICNICKSTDLERMAIELETFECSGCGNVLLSSEVELVEDIPRIGNESRIRNTLEWEVC